MGINLTCVNSAKLQTVVAAEVVQVRMTFNQSLKTCFHVSGTQVLFIFCKNYKLLLVSLLIKHELLN